MFRTAKCSPEKNSFRKKYSYGVPVNSEIRRYNLFLTISKTKELKNIASSARRVPFITQTLRERNFLAKIFIRLSSGVHCAFFMLGTVAKRFFQLTISRPQNWKGNDLGDGGGINICLHF